MKILVIEDDPDVRDSIVQTLREEAFAVDAVDNGPEGLYRARFWEYDLILLDVMLPEMDGWQVLKLLRREKRTPILMLTALNEIDDRVQGLNGGADDYLAKPYNDRELLARVRALSRRASGNADNLITLGRVVIDTASRSIRLDGEAVKLTVAQYLIVEHLALRAGQVVTRAMLIDAIGSDSDEGLSNALEVQIHRIRRLLGKDFLQNRRGLGYVIPKL